MFLVGLLSWWYGRGWVGQWGRVADRFGRTLNFFSIGYLFRTLYSPFRQISATGGSGGSLGMQFRAFLDKLISRIIGSFIRGGTIIAGIIALFFQALFEGIVMIAWWFLPLLPVVGFIMLAIGWVPSWT